MIIKTDNMSRIYNQKYLLKDVSLTFEQGKIYVIRGISGSGKTTFMNTLSLVSKPDKGSVFIDGIDPWKQSKIEEFRNRFSIILQNSFLINELDVEENILLGTGLKKLNSNALELLEEASLENKISDKARTLSVGEKQRVNIVRALIREPEVIFADEPVASLDDDNREFVKKRLLKFCEEKDKSLFIISHYDHIESDRVEFVEIDKGKVMRKG
ncbi:MAG: hypothetical protein C0601_03540 [Candidatus Muiribacterium halophilum]|uniref:ABC transporter domain-containing protein n=1 Tax=Muiribacterium halophilum TaxID=2053465 RepID=A0A2N5ZJH6_MUIH1|nr:MAG: hypothetical protein C0601_03540 [Candidatus Muirbacterium halophilum]